MGKSRATIKSVVGLNNSPWRWAIGVQAGMAMGLPIAVFTLVGEQSFGLIASLGAFTALYCTNLRWVDQLKVLPLILLGLITASFFGVLFAFNVWRTLFCLIAVAIIACVMILGLDIGSPGPLMFVLVAAVSNHIAAQQDFDFVAPGVFIIPILVAAGGLLSYLVVVGMSFLPPSILRAQTSYHTHRIAPRIRFDREKRRIATRIVIAVALAGLIASFAHVGRSYWVIIPAMAILQSTFSRRLVFIRTIHRVGGTILGVGLFGLISYWQPSGFGLIAIIMFLQFAIEVVVARNYGLALIFITPVALLISSVGQQSTTSHLIQGRIADTLLGAVIALLIIGGGIWIKASPTISFRKPKV